MNLTRPARLALVLVLSCTLIATLPACRRKKSPLVPKGEVAAESTRSPSASPVTKLPRPSGRIVYASWYEVPLLSLASRRAGPGEYTAAHNSLPLGAQVRVTRLDNEKSVVVRITDRGITNRKVKIDLCKSAAEELGMISEGIARVRIQVLAEAQAAPSPGSTALAARPDQT